MERKSLESAAANYSYLRGLFSVPVGVLVVFDHFALKRTLGPSDES